MNIFTLHEVIYLWEDVSQGDIFVCLLGFRGGWWPDGGGSSLLSLSSVLSTSLSGPGEGIMDR